MSPRELTTIAVFQTVGGAFSTSIGQAAFVNRLLKVMPTTAPSVSPALVLHTGASELHDVIPAASLAGVLQAYMSGLKAAFAVSVAFSGVAFLCTFLVPTAKLPSHVDSQEADTKPSAGDVEKS